MVACARCKGKAVVPLPGLQGRILTEVIALGKATADELMRKIRRSSITHSAMSNRLMRLYSYGLLTRAKAGRTVTYAPTPAATR